MTRFVALLRGINVGGHRPLEMGALRDLVSGLGHTRVGSHLQTGNIAFSSDLTDTAAMAAAIQAAVQTELSVDAKVLVMSRDDLVTIIESNPLPDAVEMPSRLHVAFLWSQPAVEKVTALNPAMYMPDQLRMGRGAAYVFYPNGAAKSRLTNDALERKLGVTSTMRNWNTVNALADLARDF